MDRGRRSGRRCDVGGAQVSECLSLGLVFVIGRQTDRQADEQQQVQAGIGP